MPHRLDRALPGCAAPPCGGRRGAIAPLLLLPLLLAAACVAPPPYRTAASYTVRFSDVETITLVPPLVAVYAMSSGDVEQEVQEWSDAANEHAQAAVREIVTGMGKTFVPFAGARGPRPDFRLGGSEVNRRHDESPSEQSWLLFESAMASILRHTYEPAQLFPRQMSHFDYTLGPEARALLSGTRADAFLLMIATDYVPTADRAALIGVGAAAMLATGSYAGPGATPAELTAALVDARSGDLLFFNRISVPLADLRDRDSNKALVAGVLQGMSP